MALMATEDEVPFRVPFLAAMDDAIRAKWEVILPSFQHRTKRFLDTHGEGAIRWLSRIGLLAPSDSSPADDRPVPLIWRAVAGYWLKLSRCNSQKAAAADPNCGAAPIAVIVALLACMLPLVSIEAAGSEYQGKLTLGDFPLQIIHFCLAACLSDDLRDLALHVCMCTIVA